jgi:hypothetical protein
MMRSCRCLVLLPCALLTLGCSSDPYNVVPVSGTVTFNGKPLAGAHVLFQPVRTGSDIEVGPESVGRTDAQGRFTLTTIEPERDGAMVGKHRVSVTIPEEEDRYGGGGESGGRAGPPKYTLPERYRLGTELVVEVPPDGHENLELTLVSP